MNIRFFIRALTFIFVSCQSLAELEWEPIYQSSVTIKSGYTQQVINKLLEPGFYVLEAEQKNVDVVLSFEDSNSTRVNVNSFIDRALPEELYFTVNNSNDYKFYIGAYNQSNVSSEVSFSIKLLANIENKQHITQALLLQTNGSLSNIRGELLSPDEAFLHLSQAIDIWITLDKKEQLAKLNFMTGLLTYELFMWDISVAYLQKSLLYYKSANLQVYATVANHLGAALLEKKAYSEALEFLNAAIELQDENNFFYDLGLSLNNKGLYYLYLGENIESGKFFMQAAQIFKNIGVDFKQAMSIGNYAVTELYQGRYSNAIELTNQCLLLLDQDLPKIRAAYLANLAQAQEKSGNIQSALISLSKAKEIQETHADVSGLVWTLSGMADLARRILKFDIAINYQTEAVELARVQKEHGSLINGLLNLAQDQVQLGKRQNKPILFESAYQVYTEVLFIAKSDVHKAKGHFGLAQVKNVKGDVAGAEKSINSAIAELNKLESPDVALLASMYLEKADILPDKESKNKIDLLNQAKLVLDDTKNLRLLFKLYHGFADVYLQLADLEKANKYSFQSLEFFTAHRDRVGNPWLRNNLSEWHHQLVETRLIILESINKQDAVEKSLELVDSLKAISLREQIAESKINIFIGFSEEQADIWKVAKLTLREALKQLDDLKQNKADEVDVNTAYIEVNKARYELEIARAQVNINNPKLAKLIYPGNVSLLDYKDWLDNQYFQHQTNTVILNYFIGKNKSFAWMVDANGVYQWSLPARDKLNEMLSFFDESIKFGSSNLSKSLDQLSSLLLPENIPSNAYIYIVPDGQLNTFPFASLIIEENGRKRFLAESNQLMMAPSSSMLLNHMQTKNDVMVPSENRLLLVSGNIPGYNLTYTDTEINRIADVWSGSTEILKQDQNTLEAVTSLDLSPFEYLHFATHGKVDSLVAESHGLAFTGVEGSVEYLNLSKIYDLNLSSRLVTLSACNSGQGNHVSGEGVMGLARGFIYAGSETVLATLWQISDRSTMLFMENFYHNLNETHDSASALQATQQAAIAGELGRNLRNVKNWAAFVLIGS